MLATAPRSRRKPRTGSPLPRIAPPTPARSDIRGFVKTAGLIDLVLMPWQQRAARYLTARNAQGHPLYREVAVVVARQNGKTTLLLPLIINALLEGKRVMHAAQHLRLPGEFHAILADIFETHFSLHLPSRRGISWRAGQEHIRLKGGGYYQIVAATGGAPRGPSNDLVVIDEIREMDDDRFLAGIKPTTIARPEAQLVYLSNAGTEGSKVLNALRARAGEDPRLAYLEWSAAPERAPADEAGWLEANPAIGHIDGLLENLRDEYRAALLGGTMPSFETEHLCRWVAAMDERLVAPEVWAAQDFGEPPPATRPVFAVKMAPSGERASAVVAWQLEDKRVVLDLVYDVTGHPIDADRLGPELVKVSQQRNALVMGFDPYTDVGLARHFRRSQAIIGRAFANATGEFVRRAKAGDFVVRDPDGLIAEDLAWTVRKTGQSGMPYAARADDEHTTTAAEAAIRATLLATEPLPQGIARIR